MSAYGLGTRLSIAPNQFTRWKQGNGKPSVDQALAICDALDIPSLRWLVDDRIGIDDEELPPVANDAQRLIIQTCERIGAAEVMWKIMAVLREEPRHHAPIRSVDMTRRERDGGPDGSTN